MSTQLQNNVANIPTSGASYNADGVRTELWRTWGYGKCIDILMKFPSTANAIANDKTTKRILSILKNDKRFSSFRLINIGVDGWEDLLTGEGDVILAWGYKVRMRKSTERIRETLFQMYTNIYQFGSEHVEAMPTRLSSTTKLELIL